MKLLDAVTDDYGYVFLNRDDMAGLLAVPVGRINHALSCAEFMHDLRYLEADECRAVGFPDDLAGHCDDHEGVAFS